MIRRVGVCRALLAVWVGLCCCAPLAAQAEAVRVKYRTVATVYIDVGNAEGVEPGDLFEVVRDGAVIAELRVLRIAEHSASCQLVSEKLPVEVADDVRRVVAIEAAIESGPEVEVSTGEVPREETSEQAEEQAPVWKTLARDPVSTPVVAVTPPALRPGPRGRTIEPEYTRISGSLTMNWESFVDASEVGLNTARTGARLNFRIEEIGGYPLELRIRASTRELVSERAFEPTADRTTRNRFYEASLLYDPPVSRIGYQVGRMRSGEFGGLGGLDGGIVRYALSPAFQIGGFGGSRPEVDAFDANTDRLKYGVFARWLRRESRRPARVSVAAVREEGTAGVSREFVAIDSRYDTGRRWSFFQRAEADLNTAWRAELAGKTSQLSNLSLTARALLATNIRFTMSYTRNERYRTEDTREIPVELFDDAIRQGLRVSLNGGRSGGLRYSLSAGLRDRQGADEGGYSFGGSLSRAGLTRLGLAASLNATVFSNGLGEGTIANLRASKRLGRGNRLTLTLGGRQSRNQLFDVEQRSTTWVRVDSWLELPGALFGTAEYELSQGDERQGQRASLGLGYRF